MELNELQFKGLRRLAWMQTVGTFFSQTRTLVIPAKAGTHSMS